MAPISHDATFFVGSRQLELTDDDWAGISFPVIVHYPTLTPATPTHFGPYTLDVSPGARMATGRFPLVVISHGNGGSPLLYRTISTHLAQHGYVVALPEHYGNNRTNNTLAETVENLQYRPRHIRLTIDTLLAEPDFGNRIDPERIALIGHSFGGYTALALAGGTPWTQTGQRVAVESDPRLRALVLLAPAAGWFMPPHSLAAVRVPILLLTAEHDPFTPAWNADIVRNGVPDAAQVTDRQIAGAGHFSFLSPFPATMSQPGFLPATDPDGFDRAQFHGQLPADIRQFLADKLAVH